MKDTFRPFFCWLFIYLSFCSVSNAAPDFAKKIAGRFSQHWKITQHEKVYLQTDKPYYSAGENIWFKGYLVNAATHLPKSLSEFMYVELIDKSNTVVSRVKIKQDSVGFDGFVKLNPELPAGNYALRAYTYWMQNAGADFFFTKNIYIGNSIDDYVKSDIVYGANTNGQVAATITFIDANRLPISGKKVDIYQNWDNPQNKRSILQTDSKGKITIQLALDSTFKSTRILEVSMNEPGNRYKNKFYLPEFNSDFDVQFFPESGSLLVGQLHNIAFKAIGADGLSVEVTGKVFSNKGDEVAEFSSFNKGMGKFSLQTDSGIGYYAVLKSAAGKEKRFNLPSVQSTGIAMQVTFNRGRLWYEVANRTSLADDAFYLLVHSRGRMLAAMPLSEMNGQIAESLLPPGILSLSVIDSLGNTYCERLCFVRNLNLPTINMLSDKPVYGKRVPVDLTFNIQSANGKASSGNYSISITDSRVVKSDILSDNIISNLLMTSDLKGYIEEPGSYFTDSVKIDREKLDVLMLTQGWRRFNTADVVKGVFKQPNYFMEAGQTLAGKVVNILKKPAKECRVTMTSTSLIKATKTDSLGRYLIDGIEFPDSTEFGLRAKTKFTIGDLILIPDADEFPQSTAYIPLKRAADYFIPDDYFFQSKQKYYTEGGMRVLDLEAVTVKAQKVDKSKNNSIYSSMADVRIGPAKLAESQGMNVLEILATLPGIQVNGEEVSIRGSRGNPIFLVDDVQTSNISDIIYYGAEQIEDISIISGPKAAIYGSQGGNGIVAITLKRAEAYTAKSLSSMVTVKPLGYQKPAQFYMPKYDVDSERQSKKADLRTTIYWNPKLATDSTGTVHVKFFTADKENDYSVVLEGISDKGEISRYVGKLKRKAE